MNIPEIYLVEPYNAYATKGRKKHWHEIVEEQALMARIQAEQIALQETQNRTLPENAPAPSTPTVGGTPQPGGGGVPVYPAFNPSVGVSVNFDRTPADGVAPLTVQFNNIVPNPELYIFNWEFSDGTTSTQANPSKTFHTQSSATGVYTASLQVTSSMNGTPVGRSPNVYTSASYPTLASAFTITSPATMSATFYTASLSASVVFANGSTDVSGQATYLWVFGSGSAVADYGTSSVASPSYTYNSAGTYTVRLQATGSYGITSAATRRILITA
jgi:PKD repeat protein